MKTPRRFACAITLAATWAWSCAGAATAPGSVELALQGAGPYYTLHLTLALQGRAASTDLSDMQVVNGRGDALPFAWLPPRPDTAEQHLQAVPHFKLPGAASAGRITASRAWLLDTRQVKGSLLRLDLVLPESARGVYTLAVEASSDLQHWQVVQPAVQLLSLEHDGQRLSSTSIDLNGLRAAYLRLTALPRSLLPELQSAQATSIAEELVPQPMHWSDPIGPSRCSARYCDYPMPRNVPLEQLQIELEETNTLAQVETLGEVDAVTAVAHQRRRLLRNPVTALRRKSEPASAPAGATSWEPIGGGSVYRLARPPEGEVRSAPLWLSGGFHPVLRLQTAGPVSQLGPTAPKVSVGAHTRSLVFLARGPAPYRLLWGSAKPEQAAMSLSQLLPDRNASDPLPQDLATPAVASAASAPASAPATPPAASPSSAWLWAALLGGLALMGAMAWALLRKRPADSAALAKSDAVN
jgi:hypothetical protein